MNDIYEIFAINDQQDPAGHKNKHGIGKQQSSITLNFNTQFC